ncbi:hypothetical protein QJ850_gp231 [Acanthamoeba polyphaga mimivirus]|uniref:Uncharacterized protein n=1 Tax=Acanthamoeba polyphaga mimivirus Kroon TaxID=3069720 RepID=A0A0G2Y3U5_9VIRU|nr:hypothetical protein QJ850_gp231 [Acanthamoeba polyphaga mimivirus]AKI80468.1 hypothetical protein [Acanthamoeba polyphaga mimivirus Kroon]
MANRRFTENGDKAYTTSGSDCIDFFVRITRNSQLTDYISTFGKAWNEDKNIAMKILYNLRDIRTGKGEKLIPVVIMTYLKFHLDTDVYNSIVTDFVSMYGCWKDLLKIVEIETRFRLSTPSVSNKNINPIEIKLFADQLQKDFDTVNNSTGTSKVAISLCAKWAPSEKQHYNKAPLLIADSIRSQMGLTPRQYRKMLTKLRSHLQVLEMLMSTHQHDKIDFSKLPSIALMKMKNAFNRDTNSQGTKSDSRVNLHTSYTKYLQELSKGKTKVNTKGIQPHELVGQYLSSSVFDQLVESQWDAIKKEVSDSGAFNNVTAVVDVSGSMHGQPMQVAIALGILVAECTSGPYHGRVITFHEKPSWHHLTGSNLVEKVKCMQDAPWGGSTNMKSVFDLVLQNAINAKLKPHEMIDTLFIFTDMQFNQCDYSGLESTFEYGQRKFTEAGYTFPKVVCWNLRTSNSKSLPLMKNEQGYVMLSGFSAELLKCIMNAEEFNPMSMLLHVLEPYVLNPVFINSETIDINSIIDDESNKDNFNKAVERSKFKKSYKKPSKSVTTTNSINTLYFPANNDWILN